MKIATVTSPGLNLRTHPVVLPNNIMTALTTGDKIEVHKVTHDTWQFGWVRYTRQGNDIGKAGWFNQKYVAFSEIPAPDFPHLPESPPGHFLRRSEWPFYIAGAIIAAVVALLYWL